MAHRENESSLKDGDIQPGFCKLEFETVDRQKPQAREMNGKKKCKRMNSVTLARKALRSSDKTGCRWMELRPRRVKPGAGMMESGALWEARIS